MLDGVTEHGLLASTSSYAGVRKVFSETATVSTYVQVELALARALARAGAISTDALDAIEEACDFTRLDVDAWRRGTAQVGYPIVPLVNQLAAIAGPLGHSVHLGATTQDIMDTTLVLQAREAGHVLICEVEKVCAALRELTETHRNTLMA